jgi:glycosyltransferase involved in cell wall biosynthesis
MWPTSGGPPNLRDDPVMSIAISVVIPCHNTERYLAAAIESVLMQTLAPTQIVVVNDGSTDGSGAVARGYGDRVTVLDRPNGGISAARNTGIHACDAPLLSFLDADDLWTEAKLEQQVAVLRADPHLDGVFAHAQQFISAELSAEEAQSIACRDAAMPARLASAMLVRRASFLRVGDFNEDLKIAETVDWLARADELGLQFTVLPGVMLRRRLHRSNSGVVKRDARSDYARALKAALDRRRQKQKATGSP